MRLVYDESGDAPVEIGDPVTVKGTPYYVMSVLSHTSQLVQVVLSVRQ
jgi:hypothetical protein